MEILLKRLVPLPFEEAPVLSTIYGTGRDVLPVPVAPEADAFFIQAYHPAGNPASWVENPAARRIRPFTCRMQIICKLLSRF